MQNVFGILSLVFWTMAILVTAEYAWLAMRLGRKGEGGAIVLKEILARMIRPGRQLTFVVFLTYLGQGAFIISHPDAKNYLFGMVQHQAPLLYIPFLILTIMATIIASQAMISGVFSIVYQGITTRILPLLKVDYTSSHLKSQIYIGSVNFRSNIIYERNVFTIVRTDEPFGLESSLTCGLATGLDAFEIHAGYMEHLDIQTLLAENGIKEKVIFYGVEDISTPNPIWKLFATIKRQTPNFVQFNKLPASRLQGVVTRVEM